MVNHRVIDVDTEVAIVGSGSAGQMAALSARWAGADVALVDKAGIVRSGCGAAGEDHFSTVLGLEEWDTGEVYLEGMHRWNGELCNPKTVENGYLRHIKWLTHWLEDDLGVQFKWPGHDGYIRTGPFGMPKFQINYEGVKMMPAIYKEMEKAGVRFFPRTAVTDLLVEDGHLAGVVALEFRTGDLYVFHAKATVVCTGNVGRLFDNTSNEPYNLWNSPYNTGLGHRLAFDAGAQLGNMEFIGFTVAPKNFGTPSMAAFTGMGAHLVNGAGERILFKYDPLGEACPRWMWCWAVHRETLEGRGPLFMDVRHFSEADLFHLEHHLLPVDKKTYGDYLQQKGVTLRTDLLEVEVTGGEIPADGFQVMGIDVDEYFATSVAGLYAAGGCTMVPSGLPGSMGSGMTAGENAARYAAGIKAVHRTESAKLREIEQRLFAPLSPGENSLTCQQWEAKLRQIMTRYVRIGRTKAGLETAMTQLSWLEGFLPKLKANDGHELMRCQEDYDLLAVSKLITLGALVREESRFGLSHYRGDFPETKPEWHKSILQTKKGEAVGISFKPPYKL